MLSTLYRAKYISKYYKNYLQPGQRILDIGCGNGLVTDYLITKLKLNIWGTDIDQYLKKPIKFTKMIKPSQLAFGDKLFDYALFNDVLHHCENAEALLKEAKRVADKILIFEMAPSFWARIIDKVFNFFHHRNMPVPLNFLTAKQWQKFLGDLNFTFTIIKLEKPFSFYPLNHLLIVIE